MAAMWFDSPGDWFLSSFDRDHFTVALTSAILSSLLPILFLHRPIEYHTAAAR